MRIVYGGIVSCDVTHSEYGRSFFGVNNSTALIKATEGAVSHNVLYCQQLYIAPYQVSLYANLTLVLPVCTFCFVFVTNCQTRNGRIV